MIAQRLRQSASRSRACIRVDQASADGRYGVVLFLHETAFITLAIEQDDQHPVLRLRQHIVLLQGQSPTDLDPRGEIIASCPLSNWHPDEQLILGWDIDDDGMGWLSPPRPNILNQALPGLS